MAGRNKWRIMVVDDDQPLLGSLLTILETEFEAVGAINGLDALEKIERFEPDLMILDVAMPCVDGIDTCRAIRKNARFRSLPVVFLSGQDETDYKDRVKSLGAAHFLRKPVTPAELLQCCREVIEKSGAHAAVHQGDGVTELETGRHDDGRLPLGAALVSTTADLDKIASGEQQPQASGEGQALARIMIVDDSAEVVAAMLSALRDCFEVFGVTDPVSAIYKIIRYQPDMLILDAAMPRLSGYQLSQLLRLNPNLRTIRILFVLRRSSPQEIAYAQKLGATDYLVKPIKADELLRKVTAITEAPDFIVREKALSFNDIRQAESTDPVPSQFL